MGQEFGSQEVVLEELKDFSRALLDYCVDRIDPKHKNIRRPEIYVIEPIPRKECERLIKESNKLPECFIPEDVSGKYDFSNETIIFNGDVFNKEKTSYLSATHENLHHLRKLFAPKKERKSLSRGCLDEFANSHRKNFPPTDIHEFFGELSTIVMHDFIDDNPDYFSDNKKEHIEKTVKEVYKGMGKMVNSLNFFSNKPFDVIQSHYKKYDKLCSDIEKIMKKRKVPADKIKNLEEEREKLMGEAREILVNLEVLAAHNLFTFEHREDDIVYIDGEELPGTPIYHFINEVRTLSDRLKSALHHLSKSKAEIAKRDIKLYHTVSGFKERFMQLWFQIDAKTKEGDLIQPYKRAQIAIRSNLEDLGDNWPKLFSMSWKKIEKKYFKDVYGRP
ncbi:MAG: hypothetical protein R6U32_03885 [Candidatus Woesearchaeota archaeon]